MAALVLSAVVALAISKCEPLASSANRQWMWANWADVNFLTTAHRGEGGVVTITMAETPYMPDSAPKGGVMALGWLFLYWLYRKNIFLRV